jgi:hypothetical protein
MFCCLLGLLGNGDLAPRKSSGPLTPARRSRGALRWHERSEGRVDRIRLSAGTCLRSKTAYRPACVARPDTIGCVAHESETNSHCKRRLCERIVPLPKLSMLPVEHSQTGRAARGWGAPGDPFLVEAPRRRPWPEMNGGEVSLPTYLGRLQRDEQVLYYLVGAGPD